MAPQPAPHCPRRRVWAIALGLIACARAEPSPVGAAPAAVETGPVDEEAGPQGGAPPPAISTDPVVVAIVDRARERSEVADHLRVLAVDIGPRLTGSPRLRAAEDWAVERFTAWGLPARREVWGSLPVGFERGPAEGAVIRPERAALEFTTWAWTPGTRGQDGLDAGGPVRGQALRHPSDARQLRELEPYLCDAWILVPWGFDRRRLDATARKQIDLAFERGRIAGLVFAAGDADDRLVHTHGNPEVDPAALPKRVEIRLRGDQHADLLAKLDAGEYVELEFGVANRWLDGPVEAANVIAELPGELADARVVVGAHLDSWDGASGAVDDATGVATTLEAARLLSTTCAQLGVRPKRSITFMLWSGEEQGLLGSRAWIEAHPERLEGISAVLVHDEGTNYVSGAAVTPEMWAAMTEVFAPAVALGDAAGMPFALRVVEALEFAGSDSDAFLAAGVPALFWDQDGESDYDRYHHTQHDHADAVNDAYQRHSALVIAIAAWNLANAPEPVSREHAFALAPRQLGVGLEGQGPLVVTELAPKSVAARAGVAIGDRLLTVDGAPVDDRRALVAALQRGGPDKLLTVTRGDPPATIELRLDWGDDPDEPARAQRRADRRQRYGPELRPWEPEGSDTEDLHESAKPHEPHD